MTGKAAITDRVQELRTMAENLPFAAIEMPEFDQPGFDPVQVRQPRTFVSMDSRMQSITRFLVERGTVDILEPEMVHNLFTEIHCCAHRVRQLAAKSYRSEKTASTACVDARRLISRIEAAEEELFIANRRLVVNCVKPFFWIGQVWLSDFLQEGSKALANAVRKFDYTRGTPFYSYAQKSIQNRLRNFFRDHVRSGSFGIRPNREMTLVKNIIDTWLRDYGEEPSDEILAKISDIPLEKVGKVRAYVRQWEKLPAPPISLDTLINEDGSSLHELIEDTKVEEASRGAETSEVWAAIDKLPERSRYIMKLRFIEGRTLEETGELLNLTRARIKQIQDASLKKIRSQLSTRHGTRHGE
ncbi:MAG: sigma-70 family RNA polymerase sigma factor [Verrucomicrobia bacterium]|nr:sigma-70 family RNA polymerase sigma factor [Kiritimatiellia bacterium]MCP5488562.1 sigma-70 family RNA polymerase sigma factor [Verrucomicrobiota bacterium]